MIYTVGHTFSCRGYYQILCFRILRYVHPAELFVYLFQFLIFRTKVLIDLVQCGHILSSKLHKAVRKLRLAESPRRSVRKAIQHRIFRSAADPALF